MTEPIGSKGDSCSFSILWEDASDDTSGPKSINIWLKLDYDKGGWSYHFTILSSLPKELAYLGQELENNRRITGNINRKLTMRHAITQLTDLMESLGDTGARDLLNNWFNKQF